MATNHSCSFFKSLRSDKGTDKGLLYTPLFLVQLKIPGKVQKLMDESSSCLFWDIGGTERIYCIPNIVNHRTKAILLSTVPLTIWRVSCYPGHSTLGANSKQPHKPLPTWKPSWGARDMGYIFSSRQNLDRIPAYFKVRVIPDACFELGQVHSSDDEGIHYQPHGWLLRKANEK